MNIYAAILGVLMLGFGAYSVATAKFTWNSYPIVWFAPVFFYGIYLFSKRPSIGILLISLVQGLTLQFDLMCGLTTFPAYLGMLGYYIFKEKNAEKMNYSAGEMRSIRHTASSFISHPRSKPRGVRSKIKYTLVSLLLIGIPFVPSILFDLRHDFIISKAVLNTLTSGGINLSHMANESPVSLQNRIPLRFSEMVLYSIGSMTANTTVNYGLFAALLFSVVRMAKEKSKKNISVVVLSLSVILSMFFVLLLLRYGVWAHYWINNAPIYAMLLAFGLGFLIQKYRQKVLFVVLVAGLLWIYQPWAVLSYWQKGDLDEGPQTLSTQMRVIDTIYNDAHGERFSAYHHTPPVYDYVYRYLFWWKGSTQYGFVPLNEKQKFVYVIMDGVPEDQKSTFFKDHTLHLKSKSVKTFTFGQKWPVVEKFEITESEEPVDPNFFPQL